MVSKDQTLTTAFWSGRKVLVTGAGGFIGSHLVEQLVCLGAQVRAFIKYNSRGDEGQLHFIPHDIIEQVEVFPGDLRDPMAVEDAMRSCSVVFHLGALIAIPYSYLHPVEVIETNIMGTLNILMAANKLKPERIVHTSTSEVYGTARVVPIKEDHPLQAQSPYAASKIGADKLAESFYLTYGVPVVTLRPFNTYGPRQSSRAVIPTIISQGLTNDVIKLGNLKALRDMTYVLDTVNGFIRVAQSPGVEGHAFNLGTGTEISIGDLAQMIIRLLGKQVRVEVDRERLRPDKSEVERLISDNSLALAAFGWRPKVGLEEGLGLTIQWVANNLQRYNPQVYQI